MTRRIPIVLVLMLASAHVGAQQRIFALVQANRFRAELWEGRVEGGQVVEVRNRIAAAGLGGRPVVAGGGRFVVWSAFFAVGLPSGLVAFDRLVAAGQILYPFTKPSSSSSLVSDPTRTRVFVSAGDAVLSLTPDGATSLPGSAGLEPMAVSPDGSRLYAIRAAGAGPPLTYDLVILDADTAAIVGVLPIGAAAQGVAPAEDNDSVWVISARADAPHDSLLRRLELPSGQERFAIALSAAPPPMTTSRRIVGVDEARARVVVRVAHALDPGRVSGAIETYDGTIGSMVWRTDVPGWLDAGLDTGEGRVLLLSQEQGQTGFAALSVVTGEVITSAALGPAPPLEAVAFAVPPRPPRLRAPTVSPARTVTLSWSPAPEATIGFTVEAGSAPGLSDVAVLPVTPTTLTVPGGPPGTYYVRVRARNHIGASLPSNEVAVSVP